MHRAMLGVVVCFFITGCSTLQRHDPALVRDSSGQLLGYLPSGSVELSGLLPPNPTSGSAVDHADQVGSALARNQRTSVRFLQARADDNVDMLLAFGGPFGRSLTQAEAPRTADLLGRISVDVANALVATPTTVVRRPPFSIYGANDICVPEQAADLGAETSYPSIHAAIGWANALILAEMLPERSAAILARGRDYGDSRVICGVAYPSDVEAGRMAGAAMLAKVRAAPGFRADYDAARAEMRRRLRLTPRLLPEITPPEVRLPAWMQRRRPPTAPAPTPTPSAAPAPAAQAVPQAVATVPVPPAPRPVPIKPQR